MRIQRVVLSVIWSATLSSALVFGLPTVYAQEKEPAATDELAQTRQDIADKEAEISQLDEKIKELTGKRNQTAAEAELIASKVKQLEQELAKAHLELKQTQLTITKVQQEQETTEKSIEELQEDIEDKRGQLRNLVRALYQQEQESFIGMFFSSSSFSEVMTIRATYAELQTRAVEVIAQMREHEETLAAQREDLDQQEQDLGQLASLLAAQRAEAADKEAEQADFLAAKKEEQAVYERKIKEAQEARKEIEQRVFTLKDAGVEVTLDNAFDMARYASKLTGVRAALLLGVLKVESNLGNNIGNGVYPDDMHPGSREAFVRITDKLGLDRNTAQISARPKSGKGWGGAMGPAQVMPATWEGLEPRLQQLTGKELVNPYDLTDAFVATAVYLADRGAANAGTEREAVGRYIAGPNWQYYGWYVDRVFAVTAEYEKEGL